MLNSYLLKISEEIESTELYTTQFKKEKKDHRTTLLLKSEPRLFFSFIEAEDSHHAFTAKYSMFDKTFPIRDQGTAQHFSEIIKLFETWLEEVTKYEEEQEVDDPWNFDDNESPLLLSESFSQINFDEDTDFTESESKLLKEELNKAYDHIKDNIEVARID